MSRSGGAAAKSTGQRVTSARMQRLRGVVAAGLLLAATLAIDGCVQVYPPPGTAANATAIAGEAEGGEAAAAATPTPLPAWADALKDTEAHEGFLTFHLRKDRAVLLELSESRLGTPIALTMYISRGVGWDLLTDGMSLTFEAQVLVFKRLGDKVHVIRQNTRFTADPESEAEREIEQDVGSSTVAALPIASEDVEEKKVLVDATTFFVSDYAGIGWSLREAYAEQAPGLDLERSAVEKIQSFPSNTELDVSLTFTPANFDAVDASSFSDARSIPVGLRYSLFALPDEPMMPRFADDRVGTFVAALFDFSRDQEPTPFVRYVTRWRLRKKSDAEPVSEPEQPIVFYVDGSVPRAYRQYVREGVKAWDRAFEAAGFRNAIVVKEAPVDDPSWSPEDIRYSTIRWTTSYNLGYAIGPSEIDPRTGEILNADIVIPSSFVRAFGSEYARFSGNEKGRGRGGGLGARPRMRARAGWRPGCAAALGKAQQMDLGRLSLLASMPSLGPLVMPEDYLGDAIRDLVMHEVGHTLGLAHNFRASAGVPAARLGDVEHTRRFGVTGSVMEYGAVNVAADAREQGDYWNTTLGLYDVWAIQYAYAPIYEQSATAPLARVGRPLTSPQEELPVLQAIAARAAEPELAYGSDEDVAETPYDVDPLTGVWDLGDDPFAFAENRSAIARRVLPALADRLVGDGEEWQLLRRGFAALLAERARSLQPLVRMLGGIYVSRAHKSDPGGRVPFVPLPAKEQRRALRVLSEQAFAADAFAFDPALLNRLVPSRWVHWAAEQPVLPLDFPLLTQVQEIHRALLADILAPPRLQRVVDNELRVTAGGDAFRLDELLAALTAAIWTEVGGGQWPQAISTVRRNEQRAYLDRLVEIVLPEPDVEEPEPPAVAPFPPVAAWPADAVSLARLELVELGRRVDGALERAPEGADRVVVAHLRDARERIRLALEARLMLSH
ncbi:MAG: zinc-dependent metalloprotease [Candidatus Schekmanbacteria bacterium]|nr:zinc-dependent metalloprotease [Candidatus Schekmanbacteria bacterium]